MLLFFDNKRTCDKNYRYIVRGVTQKYAPTGELKLVEINWLQYTITILHVWIKIQQATGVRILQGSYRYATRTRFKNHHKI